MAFEIVWTKRDAKGYDRIVNYLNDNFTERKIINFIVDTDKFFETLCSHPEILQKTAKHKYIHRGPIDKLTILTYRIKPVNKQIVLINIRGARQKPLK